MKAFDPKTYWEERLNDSFSLHGVGYKGLGERYNEWLYRLRRKVFHRSLRKLPESLSDVDVLDVGCGTGFYIKEWAAAGVKSITGADLTDVAVNQMRTRYPEHRFEVVDIGDTTGALAGETFALVSAFDVLFHIVDDALFTKALENIIDLMEPGGYFIWSDNFLHRQPRVSQHQVSRTLAFIETALADAGFEIISRKPMFYLMNQPLDTHNRLLLHGWNLMQGLAGRAEWIGNLIGALLYPVESLLVRLFTESPTTEIMVCRKPETS